MRIKRFIAPDMRTALRLVREDQGPDAVILSNRTTPEGIEVVAATDYDEALAAQALRAAMPTLEAPVLAQIVAPAPEAPAPVVAPVVVEPTTLPPPPRESLMSRARAIFKLGHDLPDAHAGATLAELTASATPAANDVPRFEQMMAAFDPPAPTAEVPVVETPAPVAIERTDSGCDADYLIALGAPLAIDAEPVLPIESRIEAIDTPRIAPERPRPLHAVPAVDPAMAAMRTELANMRQLMEKQLDQFSLERLRGAPSRAAALDALLAFGCDPALAQAIATDIDPRLPLDALLAPLRAALAERLPVLHAEPIDEGGVIALVGPTGAGKTTVAAKLAARFAARHRARDVALVSIDRERAGGSEYLHALGRRLGITVCDSDPGDALSATLDQLQDYPLVLVDTAGFGVRDRALLRQILWLRSASRVRSLLVLPANANPLDLGDLVRRYRPAAPEGVVLTKLDETGRPGAALSMLAAHDVGLAYATNGQSVPGDIEAADADRLAATLELPAPASTKRDRTDTASETEGRHAFA